MLTIVHWNASHHILAVLQAKVATANGICCIQSFIDITVVTKTSCKIVGSCPRLTAFPFTIIKLMLNDENSLHALVERLVVARGYTSEQV